MIGSALELLTNIDIFNAGGILIRSEHDPICQHIYRLQFQLSKTLGNGVSRKLMISGLITAKIDKLSETELYVIVGRNI